MTDLSRFEWFTIKAPPTRAEVNTLQEDLEVKFPDSFIELLMNFHGASPSPDEFDYASNTTCVQNFYLANDSVPKSGSILKRHKFLSDRLPAQTIPIASTPSGDQICFDFSAGTSPRVVLCDHEVDDDEGRMIKYEIAGSFDEFLAALK